MSNVTSEEMVECIEEVHWSSRVGSYFGFNHRLGSQQIRDTKYKCGKGVLLYQHLVRLNVKDKISALTSLEAVHASRSNGDYCEEQAKQR